MPFDEFLAFATSVRLEDLDDRYNFDDTPEAQAQVRGRFTDAALLARLPGYDSHDNFAFSELSFFIGLGHALINR